MKCLCITGATQPELNTVAGIFQQAGMKPPISSRRDEAIEIGYWHEQVIASAHSAHRDLHDEPTDESLDEQDDEPQAITNPGRLWEQLASDIFIANIRSKAWGWADTRSTWLLDYWLNFETRLNFVLVCTSLEQMLAGTLAADMDSESVDALVNAWQVQHQQLLRFYHRNPQRCLLVSASDCAAYPAALIERCNSQWKLSLVGTAELPALEAPSPLALHLARQIASAYPQTAGLQQELGATMTRLGQSVPASNTAVLDTNDLLADYRALCDRSAELQQIQAIHAALAATNTQHAAAVARHQQQQKELEAKLHEQQKDADTNSQQQQKELAAKLQQQKELEAKLHQQQKDSDAKSQQQQKELAAKLQQHKELEAKLQQLQKDAEAKYQQQQKELAAKLQQQKELDAKLKESGQESELLLLQLHQVQEELEAIFLKQQADKGQLAALTQAKAALEQEKAALAATRDKLQKEAGVLAQAKDEQAKLAAERQKRIEALTKTETTLAQEKSALTAARDKLQKEAAVLTQAKDEQAKLAAERQKRIEALTKIEVTLTQEKAALAATRDKLQKDAGVLAQTRDEQTRLAAERQKRIEALTKTEATLTQEKAALAATRDTLQKDAAVLTQARDAQTKLAADRQKQLETLTAANLALAKEKATLEKEKAVLAARPTVPVETPQALADRKAQAEALKAAQGRLKDASQENELLLLQLHQVQEELEHYFLQHQSVQKQLGAVENRWQRMLQRSPDYCDYAAIDVVKVDEQGTTTWRIKEFNAGGRTLNELQFSTIIQHGIAGIVLSRQGGTNGPLLRWPEVASGQNELTIIPVGTRGQIQKTLDILLSLATQDWDLLLTLIQLLARVLEAPATLKAPDTLPVAALRNGLAKLREIVEGFPVTLRYDGVSLKREQVNHDYEHLWLQFDNFAFGKQRWPTFEFRLSCANVRPKLFGNYPKLEFPEGAGQAPFDSWFVEAHDDFGNKLELRFAQPDSMDIGVWKRLSEHDQTFLSAFVARLPAALATLRDAGVHLNRPWADWDKMANDVLRILSLSAAPAPSLSSTPASISTLVNPAAVAPPPAAVTGVTSRPKASKAK